MENIFRGDGFSMHALNVDELKELLEAKGDIQSAISRFLERGIAGEKGKCKFQPGHRVAVVDGPYKGMYGHVLHVGGCEALCFTDKNCKIVSVTPDGGIPKGMECNLNADDDGSTMYMVFTMDELEHID